MKKGRILLILGLVLLHCTAALVYSQSDTISADSTLLNEGLIAEMSTETKALSEYFSFPKLLLTIIIIGLTYLFLRVVSGLLHVWGERTTRHRLAVRLVLEVGSRQREPVADLPRVRRDRIHDEGYAAVARA